MLALKSEPSTLALQKGTLKTPGSTVERGLGECEILACLIEYFNWDRSQVVLSLIRKGTSFREVKGDDQSEWPHDSLIKFVDIAEKFH